jgi:hypothetical protein
MSRRAAAVAAAALVAVGASAGCTGPDARQPASVRPLPSPASTFVIPSPVLSPHPYTTEDLPEIVLSRGDTPPGTEFAPQYSVDLSIDQFASDDEELTALRGDAFVLGHISLFVPEGQLEHDPLPAEPGAVFVHGVAGLFETPVGADSSLHRYVTNLRAFQLERETRIPAEGLGDASEGLRGRLDGEPVTIYAWRTANLVLVVSGSGTMPSHEVRALADVLQRRADSAR